MNKETETKYQVAVKKKSCKACGICIALCPKEVFGSDKKGKSEVMRMDECIGCGMCQVRCPEFAIELEVTSYE